MKPLNTKNEVIVKKKNAKFVVNFAKIESIMIKCLLDFLTLEDLDAFSRISKSCNEIFKTYIHIRVHIETGLIKLIEADHADVIHSIDSKRVEYYKTYEIPVPNKERAIQNLTAVSSHDISELKKLKGSGLIYELCAVPFIVLFEDVFIQKGINFKSEKASKWACLVKLLQQIDFYKLISEYNIEALENRLAYSLEELIAKHSEYYNINQITTISLPLSRLIKWVYGLLEIHKFIRKFYISLLDKEILAPEEIEFAKSLDQLQLRSYKLMRSMETYYAPYQNKALQIMKALNQ